MSLRTIYNHALTVNIVSCVAHGDGVAGGIVVEALGS